MLFQSTHPARGATSPRTPGEAQLSSFQSTHPAWGATAGADAGHQHGGISIHAPREGCDCPTSRTTSLMLYFNPRTPRGVRHARL